MLKNAFISVIVLANVFIIGCVSQPVRDSSQSNRVTVGTVQKEITIGMSAASVASVLGSPNIVTSDDSGGEVWIYDKISSNVSYSSSGNSLFLGGLGSGVLGAIGVSSDSGQSSSSEKTLTIIIKFDSSKKVSSFKYHTSRF